MAKTSSADDYKLSTSFEEVKRVLQKDHYRDRLQRPLAYWALPNDRRLPLAFLGRTVGDLLSTPFDKLSSTAGIGQKKIGSLVKLLHRATQEDPPSIPFGIDELRASSVGDADQPDNVTTFDSDLVSEALWNQWCETVRANAVGDEKLGRLAPTLQTLPTVIWGTSLNEYVNYSVSEIRQLKTHGEKRVRVVLEVFYLVHELISSANRQGHLDVRLIPKFIPPIEEWVSGVLERGEIPSDENIKNNLTRPMVAQIEVDAGPAVAKLVKSRLGVDGPPQSVRLQSRELGVTRARIYQLLDDCSKIMNVRWPEGDERFSALATMFERIRTDEEQLRPFSVVREIFYPGKYSQLLGENG